MDFTKNLVRPELFCSFLRPILPKNPFSLEFVLVLNIECIKNLPTYTKVSWDDMDLCAVTKEKIGTKLIALLALHQLIRCFLLVFLAPGARFSRETFFGLVPN